MSRPPSRLPAIMLAAVLLVVLSSTFFFLPHVQAQRADVPANNVRMLPHRPARTTVRAPTSGPATTGLPATMAQNFEDAWPADGWTLQDFGTSGGEYLLGKRDCQPASGSYAGWTVGGGANGASLACGEEYPDNVYSVATYGPFDLTNAASSAVTFAFTGASEQDVDALFVGASIDDYYYCGVEYSGDLHRRLRSGPG